MWRASAQRGNRPNRGQRDARPLLPPVSVILADPFAPLALPPPALVSLSADALPELELELDHGSAVDSPRPALTTPKTSCAVGAGGVAGAQLSAPAAGLLSPQVRAERPALPLAPDHFAFALLAFSFVLVWLAAWVGLAVVPLGALHASGLSSPLASATSLVVMLALLALAFYV